MAPPQAQAQPMMMAPPQPMMMMPPPPPPPQPRPWTKEEDKVFEALLVRFPENLPNRWIYVAAQLPGRNAQEAWEHYQALVTDINLIERGLVETPDSWDEVEDVAGGGGSGSGGGRGPGRSAGGEERRRGVPWSEEEHRYAARGGSRRQNCNFPLLVFFYHFPLLLLGAFFEVLDTSPDLSTSDPLDPDGPPCQSCDRSNFSFFLFLVLVSAGCSWRGWRGTGAETGGTSRGGR
jgi:hypothetical protein